MEERQLVGLDYLSAVTALLRRVRRADATFGRYEAADLQWWWRIPRPTDDVPQAFWFDDDGEPLAAAILTDWGDGVALDPILMPGASTESIEGVVQHGLAHAAAYGLQVSDVEVDAGDRLLQQLLRRHGFDHDLDAIDRSPRTHMVEAWISRAERPAISPLPPAYRLRSRAEMQSFPHHMSRRSGPGVEARLRQTSLYDAAFDLLIVDEQEQAAAYALFWFDPLTATGLVEPMRTEDHCRRRGLARHLLTVGVDRLANAGAARVKICFAQDNAAARSLYLSAGFKPVSSTLLMSRSLAVTPAR